jgi:hypothetical protein
LRCKESIDDFTLFLKSSRLVMAEVCNARDRSSIRRRCWPLLAQGLAAAKRAIHM